MSNGERPTKRHFTDAARAAAMAKRRELSLNPRDPTTPEIFVVRLAPASKAFTWEIRRFGGVIIERGEMGFASTSQAYGNGALALAALAQP